MESLDQLNLENKVSGRSVLELWGPDIDSKSVKRPMEKAIYKDQTHVS